MDGWMVDESMDGGWIDGWMMDGRMDGWMMDGWTCHYIFRVNESGWSPPLLQAFSSICMKTSETCVCHFLSLSLHLSALVHQSFSVLNGEEQSFINVPVWLLAASASSDVHRLQFIKSAEQPLLFLSTLTPLLSLKFFFLF